MSSRYYRVILAKCSMVSLKRGSFSPKSLLRTIHGQPSQTSCWIFLVSLNSLCCYDQLRYEDRDYKILLWIKRCILSLHLWCFLCIQWQIVNFTVIFTKNISQKQNQDMCYPKQMYYNPVEYQKTHYWGVNIDPGLVPSGNKTFIEPMLNQGPISRSIFHHDSNSMENWF